MTRYVAKTQMEKYHFISAQWCNLASD